MERERFQCEDCGSVEETLHVHHCYYKRGWKPWEYPDEALKCLCKNCHDLRGTTEQRIKELLANCDGEELYWWYRMLLEWVGFGKHPFPQHIWAKIFPEEEAENVRESV